MILISRRGAAEVIVIPPPPPFEGGTPFTCHFGSLLEEEYKREKRQRKVEL